MDISERILRISVIVEEIKALTCFANPIDENLGVEPATRLLQEAYDLVDEVSKP
jgi:hypothetical protein